MEPTWHLFVHRYTALISQNSWARKHGNNLEQILCSALPSVEYRVGFGYWCLLPTKHGDGTLVVLVSYKITMIWGTSLKSYGFDFWIFYLSIENEAYVKFLTFIIFLRIFCIWRLQFHSCKFFTTKCFLFAFGIFDKSENKLLFHVTTVHRQNEIILSSDAGCWNTWYNGFPF